MKIKYDNFSEDIQQNHEILKAGKDLKHAGAAMILIHGRGATAQDILTLVPELKPNELAFLAPQAQDYAWYPYSFLEPIKQNEPQLSKALELVTGLLSNIEGAGIPVQKTFLLGFSQGACLALEFAARNPKRYGGIIGLSGGLIGPEVSSNNYKGTLEKTPVFLGCSDVDPHIPKNRVEETAEIMNSLNGKVDLRLYPQMGHTINFDEIDAINEMIKNANIED
jgi:predicted esterase